MMWSEGPTPTGVYMSLMTAKVPAEQGGYIL